MRGRTLGPEQVSFVHIVSPDQVGR
jgi:hypothetical protein